MMNVGSLSATGTVFDLNTQGGITHLLASIRLSTIAPDQKSELRDLVFLYTNGGKDQSVRIALEQKISAYHLQPAPQKAVAQKLPPAPAIGTYRPSPSFQSPPAPAQQSQPAVDFATAPAWKPTPTPQAAPSAPSSPQVTQIPVNVAPSAPIQEPVVVTAPLPPAAVVAAPVPIAPVIAADDQEYLKRIREIKALVNTHTGWRR